MEKMNRRNVFICHSRKDKDKVVYRLVEYLEKNNISVWFDEAEIRWGDSITMKINEGLKISDYVIVVLSLSFLKGSFTRKELFSTLSSDVSKGINRILPLIVGSKDEITKILEEVPIVRDIKHLVWNADLSVIVNELNKLLFQKGNIEVEEKSKKIHRKLLMISSVSFSKKNFFPRMTTEIVTQGEDRGFDVIIKMASSEADYRSDEHLIMLHRLLSENNLDCDAICIIPTEPKFTTKFVIELMQKYNTPIIAVDVRYEREEEFYSCGLNPPPIIQVDNIKGGKLAAEIMIGYCVEHSIYDPLILTILGPPDLKHSIDRVAGFENETKKLLPKCQIFQLEPGNWFRERAEKSFDNWILGSEYIGFLGVFAGNDEMALGIRRSILKHKRMGKKKIPEIIKIVGFDNIVEIEELMREQDPFILGTIDQNLKSMAIKLYDVVDDILNGKQPPKEVLIDPFAIKTNYC